MTMKKGKIEMRFKTNILLLLLISIFTFSHSFAQKRDKYGNPMLKTLSPADAQRIFGKMYAPKYFKTTGDPRIIKESIISGNAITTIVFNYGSICAPNRLPNIADLVWHGLGYGFEFGPLAAAEVIGDSGQVLHITDDSFIKTFQGDYDPTGTLKWGWLPKPGFVDTTQNEIARLDIGDKNHDGKPDSWPASWYSPGAGKYLWPAFLGDQATAPDEEVYYVDDDYTNAEFPYTPFPSDSNKKGLGLDMEVRIIQFNNPLAQNILFLVYDITNSSEKDLDKVYFGMQGDPHIGGYLDYSDDYAGFVDSYGRSLQNEIFPQRSRNMVYAWDNPPVGMYGRPTGYFGWKFLESPSNSHDGIDNDDDGITDESPDNSHGNFVDGVSIPLTYKISNVAKYTAIYGAPKPRWAGDENGNWDPSKDDVGIDGIGPDSKNYPGPDYGEGDGVPSQAWYLDLNHNDKYDKGEPLVNNRLPGYQWAGSEPNFGRRDVAESDQIGLSSFHAAQYTNSLPNVPMNDPLMWAWLSADTIDTAQKLLSQPGDNIFNFGTGPMKLRRGESQRFSMAILFANDLDGLVLTAETSSMILEANYQFAQPPTKPIVKAVSGNHKVTLYWGTRSEQSIDNLTGEKDFEGYKIYRSREYTFSDVYSITDGKGNSFLGKPLAQFDLVDSLKGFSEVGYAGRGVKFYLGNNSGLVHSYVDSNVTDGVRYFYAVVAYDRGTKSIPPTENKAVILKDPITGKYTYDVNTVSVIPGGIGAGLSNAEAGNGGTPRQIIGNSTGPIHIKVLDNLKVEKKLFSIKFITDSMYNVIDSTGVTESFVSKDTVFADLSNKNIELNSVVLTDANGSTVDTSKYFINSGFGKIRGLHAGDLPKGEVFNISYRYYPIYKSTLIDNEDYNPAFDGMKIFVKNDSLKLNFKKSGWLNQPATNIYDSLNFKNPVVGTKKTRVMYRANWEVRWNNTTQHKVIVGNDTTWVWDEPGDTVRSQLSPMKPVVVTPFKIWNVTDNKPAQYLVIEKTGPGAEKPGRWNFGEWIVVQPQGEKGFKTTFDLMFNLPKDPNVKPILPKKGDIFEIITKKPFQKGDIYEFNTQPVEFKTAQAKSSLDNIYVVPNPYVAYDIAEEPGRTTTERGREILEFRNLPPKCTIRIYTVTGELVKTIHKNDMTSMATWDLLTFEGQRIAYGVYIFQVEVPGVGSTIGRFAVIK